MNRKNNILIFVIDIIVLVIFGIPIFLRSLRKKSAESSVKKILILELWGIGDVVMMSAVLKPLREKYRDAKIVVLGKAHASQLLTTHPQVDQVVTYDFPWTAFKRKHHFWRWDWNSLKSVVYGLKEERFDLILDARGEVRNNILSFFIDAKRRIGYNWCGGGLLLTDVVPFSYRQGHRVDDWLKLLNYIEIPIEGCLPSLGITDEDLRVVQEFLKVHQFQKDKGLIAIFLGAAQRIRCWPLDRFVALVDKLKAKDRFQLIGVVGPDQYGLTEFEEGNIPVFSGTLLECSALFAQSQFLISNDTGLMHCATAVGTSVVCIVGPGDVKKFGPYGDGHRVVIKEGIECRPCFDSCIYDESFCLTEISVDDVMCAVDELKNS